MKKILSFILSICLLFTISGCETVDFGNLYSQIKTSIEDNLYVPEEIVEITYEEYEIRNPQFKSCYNSLNSNQREFYSVIAKISEEMPDGFVRLGKNTSTVIQDATIAYKAFLSDHAEVFWMPRGYILGTSNNSSNHQLAIAFQYSKGKTQNSYNVSKAKRDKMISELDNACETVISAAKKLKTEYEQEKYINDFLCDRVTYTVKGDFIDTSYGAIVKGKALCEGYARAFKLLCNKLDIECDLIVGEAENIGHMWNRVNIDKKLSYVDVTWNDRSKYKTYTYFNITEEQLLADHTLAPLFTELKTDDLKTALFNFTKKDCGFSGNSFYEKNKRLLWNTPDDGMLNAINEALKNNIPYVEFMFATKNAQAVFEGNPDDFVADIHYKLKNTVINSYSIERDTVIFFFE